MRNAHTNSMLVGAFVLLALFFSSCAIPVRPIAFLEQDEKGRYHFVQDETEEPHLEDAAGWLAPILGLAGGPYGEGALALLTLVLGHQVGHRRGKKAATAKPKTIPIHPAPAPAESATVTLP